MTEAKACTEFRNEFLFRVLVFPVAEDFCTVSEFMEHRSPELLVALEVLFVGYYYIPVRRRVVRGVAAPAHAEVRTGR